MSKTYRKWDGYKSGSNGKAARSHANRILRQKLKKFDEDGGFCISNGRNYKKVFESWDITDWRCFKSPAEQSYCYHHPYQSSYGHPCSLSSYLNGCDIIQWVSLPPKEKLPRSFNSTSGQWEYSLPPGGFFPSQSHLRLNPITGEMEYQRTVWSGYDYKRDINRLKMEWVPCVAYKKYAKVVDTFIYRCSNYADDREEDTRNYRKRRRWNKQQRRFRQDRNISRNQKCSFTR